MKGISFAAFILACLLAGSGCMTGSYTRLEREGPPEPDTLALTTQDIIDMSKAKIGDEVIIKMIRTTDSYFNLRSRDVVALADSGVRDRVIEVMINTSREPERRWRRYYYPAYHPPYYWWGAYPYWYPWRFGVSISYHAPWYRHRHYAPHYHGGDNSGGGRGPGGGSRSSGPRR